jgi:2,4-dienoyl-CoA reductase-like NADH-dependent reductase (Old Yellow Enzyme family)
LVKAKNIFSQGTTAVKHGVADLVTYGMSFLANPDLLAKYRSNARLNSPNPATIYAHGALGYTDYPFMKVIT